jgi:hypothetical protein
MKAKVKSLITGVVISFVMGTTCAQVHSVGIVLSQNTGIVAKNAARILSSQIRQRCQSVLINKGKTDLIIQLELDSSLGRESFSILDGPKGIIKISGGDECGIIYGAGKFLHTSNYYLGRFTPGLWRGYSSPHCKIRGIYFATHFGNFYEHAPIEEIQAYINSLALWGVNYLMVTFPRWQFTGFKDPEAKRSLARLKIIMRAAKSVGMKVAIGGSNEDFKTTPTEFLRTPVPDPLKRRGNFGVNLDPAKVGAHIVLRKDWSALMDQFKDVSLDAIVFWPYDEGGCGCDECWPWGARGYPKLCQELAKISRDKFSSIEIMLSTWMFDTPPAGEWEGLAKYLENEKGWANYILADSHEGFPRYPLEKGVPGGLPLLNFPEISMWGQKPWGGYGANPFPARLQHLWNQTESKLSGGFPYSEGIYEDINEIICSQLYWDGNRSTTDIVQEYISFEFSPEIVDNISKVVKILEANHNRKQIGENALEAFQLIQEAEVHLQKQIRESWRWRILYLRAQIDSEIFHNKGELKGEKLRKAFNELTAIYHAEKSHSMPIHPPVLK